MHKAYIQGSSTMPSQVLLAYFWQYKIKNISLQGNIYECINCDFVLSMCMICLYDVIYREFRIKGGKITISKLISGIPLHNKS